MVTNIYPFGYLADTDQGTGTSIRPFGHLYPPQATGVKCYNALFGKGNYESADPNLIFRTTLQDDPSSGFVIDEAGASGNYSGTVTQTTGPPGKSYIPNAVNFSSGNLEFDDSEFNSPDFSNWSALFRAKADAAQQDRIFLGWYSSTAGRGWNIKVGGFNAVTATHTRSDAFTTTDAGAAYTNNQWFKCHAYATDSLLRTLVDNDTGAGTSGNMDGTVYTAGDYKLLFGSNRASGAYFDGDMCDLAVFTRAISTDEASEWDAGPEPYLISGTPSISGTVQRGENIYLSPGTWSTSNNGIITYTYSLYSYSDTSGSDERLEKEIIDTRTSVPILLSGADIVGRYLLLVVTAENSGGLDPSEVYTSSYTSAVAYGSDTLLDSYNALFGRGRHLQDNSLIGIYDCQQSPSSIFEDVSVNNNDGTVIGTLESGSNPDAPWLNNSLRFLNDRVNVSDFVNDTGTQFSFFTRHERSSSDPDAFQHSQFEHDTNAANRIRLYSENGAYKIDGSTSSGNQTTITFSTGNTVLRSWHTVGFSYDQGDIKLFFNGEVKNSGSWNGTITANRTYIGGRGAGTNPSRGDYADVTIFEKSLSNSEFLELNNGPEPLSIVLPTLLFDEFTWSGSLGTWDSQSNGTISYNWELRDISNVAVQSGTGTPTGNNPTAGDYYLWVRATNDGGYDPAEDSVSSTQTIQTIFIPRSTINSSINKGIINGGLVT